MTSSDALERGREAFRRQAWADAYSLLSTAADETALDPGDLELHAKAAYLTGKETDCVDIWARAQQEFRDRGHTRKAARAAFWIGMILFNQGDHAQGSGWMARARRLAADYQEECVEEGFLRVPEALRHLRKGDAETARTLFGEATGIGKRFGNPDLMTLGRLGQGQALIHQQKIEEGTTLLDEVMVSVVSDEISPIVAGIVYCAVIDTCRKIYDLRRAKEWTAALSRWCDSQPDLIPYRGQCLVRRAEIMQLRGDWPDAMNEARRACDLSQSSSPPAGGEAFYRRAELYRLQGDFSKAEETYQQASTLGRKPQPGLALLRLAQERLDAAVAAIRLAEEEAQDRTKRSRILPAFVEIMVAADQKEAARDAARELSGIADELDAPYLKALAGRAEGNVLLEEGEPRDALDVLRGAWSLLNEMEASYESARTRVLIGRACRDLGDGDTAQMELDAARSLFQKLGASPDLDRLDSMPGKSSPESSHGLTPRELEVLRLLATGKTNKEIASELYISERTVDRHVSNILGKLDLPSRAAATAYAYEHDLM